MPLVSFSRRMRRKHADDSETRLLRTAGSGAESERQGYPCVLSQAGAQISSGFESRRQIRGRKIQTTAGSLRRTLRFHKTEDVRPVRLLQPKPPTRRGGAERRAAPG